MLKLGASFLLTSKTYTATDKESCKSKHATTTLKPVYRGFGNACQIYTAVQDPTHHKKLFLKDGEGNLHDVELTNWNICIAEGQEITIVWPMEKHPDENTFPFIDFKITLKEAKDMGNILAIKNHHTGQMLINQHLMRAMARNPWWLMVPIVAILLFLIFRIWVVPDAGIGSFLLAILFATAIWKVTYNPQRHHQLKVLVENMLD